MPSFTADDVVRVAEGIGHKATHYDFPAGSCAFFIAINDEWGWKGYWREAMYELREQHYMSRDYNYDLSKIAAERRVGPTVGDKLDVELGGMSYKGFVVQRADTLADLYDMDKLSRNDIAVLISGLRVRLRAAGMGDEDMGSYNCGFVPDNPEVVAIDFSHSKS